MNNLDKSDDNLNPEAYKDRDEEDLTKYAKLCQDPKTTDSDIKEILFDLLDRKFTVELLIKSKIGVCVSGSSDQDLEVSESWLQLSLLK